MKKKQLEWDWDKPVHRRKARKTRKVPKQRKVTKCAGKTRPHQHRMTAEEQMEWFWRGCERASAGRKAAAAGAKRAVDHAGDAWKGAAYDAILDYAGAHDAFTIEDVRLANPWLPEPPDRRAWGWLAAKVHRAGFIAHAGFSSAKSPIAHNGPKRIWRKCPLTTP